MEMVSGYKVWEWLPNITWKKMAEICILAVLLWSIYDKAAMQIKIVPEMKREAVCVNGMHTYTDSASEVRYFNQKIAEVLERRKLAGMGEHHMEDTGTHVQGAETIAPAPVSDVKRIGEIHTSSGTKNTEDIVEDAGQINADVEEAPPVPVWNVTFYGNGGTPEVKNLSFEGESFSLESCSVPKRLGKMFDGWYTDAACTVPYAEGSVSETEIILYAGWRELDGVICNDSGYIIDFPNLEILVTDGLLMLPRQEMCRGIMSSSLEGIGENVFEIFIPKNIEYIEPGTFESLFNLMYIEVEDGNPVYYSEGGVLYHRDGMVIAMPQG